MLDERRQIFDLRAQVLARKRRSAAPGAQLFYRSVDFHALVEQARLSASAFSSKDRKRPAAQRCVLEQAAHVFQLLLAPDAVWWIAGPANIGRQCP